MKFSCLGFLILSSSLAYAQDSDFSSSSAKTAKARYETTVQTATKAYLQDLKRALESAMTNRDLEEANRITSVITRIEQDFSAQKGTKHPLFEAISTLPLEDQQIIKGLKFSDPEPAPLDTRGFTFIKSRIQVSNTGPKHSIMDKLQIEMRILCRNKNKEWSVIRCVKGFDIADKGKQVITLSFDESNDLFLKLNGDKKAKLFDFYTVVRYKDVIVFESPGKTISSLPNEWWKDDQLVYNK